MKRRVEQEIDEELRFHLEMRTRDNIAAGMSPEAAAADARRRFGNLLAIKDEARDARGWRALDVVLRDLRIGARMLRRQPGFTVAAVATLAIGIAAATAVFAVVDSVLLRALPIREPERVISVWQEMHEGETLQVSSMGNFAEWRAEARSLEKAAAYFGWNANLTGGGGVPERLVATMVTGDFFEVLGVAAARGRALVVADEKEHHGAAVCVLGAALWRRRFAADPDVVGKTIVLDGNTTTIVGVMPDDFQYPRPNVELWAPAAVGADRRGDRQSRFLRAIARLAPGASLDDARAELAILATRQRELDPKANLGLRIAAAPLEDTLVGSARTGVLVLLGAVAFVLLLSCLNVAGLLLARAAARGREMTIRLSLGASRGRLVVQLLTESLLLAALGGAAGVVLGHVIVQGIVAWNPGSVPRLAAAVVDGRVIAVALAVSLASTVAFGLWPALVGSRPGAGPARGRVRHGLVVVQVAAAFVLLIGAGLTLQSFVKLSGVDPGFDPRGTVTFQMWLPSMKYQENARQLRFVGELASRIGALPGVSAVGAVQDLPLRKNRMTYDVAVEGDPVVPGVRPPDAGFRTVTPGYFATLGIPILEGRGLTDADDAQAPPVVVVNRSFAAQRFPGRSALGKRLRFDGDDAPWRTIVGVVGDVKHMGLDADEGATFYQPYAQKPDYVRWLTFVVRGDLDEAGLAASVRRELAALDPDQPIYDVVSLPAVVSRSVATPRFYAALLGGFALVALLLAAVGVYGVLAFLVTQRTRELGIHLALGARPGQVLVGVLGKGLRLALLGIVAGVVGALALGQFLESLLFGIAPTDGVTYVGISVLLGVVAVVACLVPAVRAMRLSPMVALQREG